MNLVFVVISSPLCTWTICFDRCWLVETVPSRQNDARPHKLVIHVCMCCF